MGGELYVVTGAAGFLGSQMVWRLLDQGKDVRATDIRTPSWLEERSSEQEAGQLEFIRADLTDYYSLLPALDDATFAFHFGALFDHGADEDLLMRINAGGTENLFRAAVASGLERVVHIGSVSVYGHDQQPGPGERFAIHEGKQPAPADPYARSKQASREIAAQFNGDLDVFIVDPAGIFGPYSSYGNVSIIRMAMKGMFMLPDGKHPASMVHSEDVVRLCDHLIHSPIRPEGNDPQELSYLSTDLTPLNARELMELVWDALPETARKEKLRTMTSKVSVKKGMLKTLAQVVDFGTRAYNATLGNSLEVILGIYAKAESELNPHMAMYSFGDHSCDPAKMLSTGFEPRFPRTEDTIRDVVGWHKRHGLLMPYATDIEHTFESLVGAADSKLEALLREGRRPLPEGLDGEVFDGYNLTPMADRLGICKFRKGFYLEDGGLKGYNIRVKQNAFEDPWQYPAGLPERFGWYDVLPAEELYPDLAAQYPGALVLRYDEHNAVMEGKMLRDLIVEVGDGLLLGKAFNKVGEKLLFPSYFVLRRAEDQDTKPLRARDA